MAGTDLYLSADCARDNNRVRVHGRRRKILTVNSDPAGAEVWVAGKFVGYAPVSTIVTGNSMTNMRIEVPPGNTYQVWRGVAYVLSGQEVSMNVTMYKKTKNAKEEGIVVVTSNVEGAKVYMDYSYYGSISGETFSIDKIKLGLCTLLR